MGTPWNRCIHILQPRLGGVRVPNVGDARQHPDSLANEIHRPVGHAYIPGRQCDGPLSSSIGTEDRIPSPERSEQREGLSMVILRKDRISDRDRPVANHQDPFQFPDPAFELLDLRCSNDRFVGLQGGQSPLP